MIDDIMKLIESKIESLYYHKIYKKKKKKKLAKGQLKITYKLCCLLKVLKVYFLVAHEV